MGVGEPGEDRGAPQIHHPGVGADQPLGVPVPAHEGDLVPPDGDGLCPGRPVVRGVDLCIPQHDVGGGRLLQCERE